MVLKIILNINIFQMMVNNQGTIQHKLFKSTGQLSDFK